MHIHKAQIQHVPSIVSIAKEYEYNLLKQTKNFEKGFLVSDYSESDYHNFITISDHFYVALDNETVMGFLLAFSRNNIPESEWLVNNSNFRIKQPYILIKQIAVAHQHLGEGIATQLYKHLMEHNPNVSLLAAIVLSPLNKASIDFHQDLGFFKLFEATASDKLHRSIWCFHSLTK